MRPSLIAATLLTAAVAIMVGGSVAAVPKMVNYQGWVTATDVAFTDTVDMLFAIYDAETSGEELWSEPHTDVVVDSGSFSVILGSNFLIPENIFSQTDLWLEVAIEGEIIEPRTRLTSMPYSFATQSVQGDVKTSPGQLQIGEEGAKQGNVMNLVANEVGIWLEYATPDQDCVLVISDEGLFVLPIALPDIQHLASYTGHGVTLVDSASGDTSATLEKEGLRFSLPGVLPVPVPYPAAEYTANGIVLVDSATGDSSAILDPRGLTFIHPRLGSRSAGDIAKYEAEMMFFLDSAGDTTMVIQPDRIQMKAGAADGHVLTCDANGKGLWQAPGTAACGWTDDGPVVRLNTDYDSVGIGTNTPQGKLHVVHNSSLGERSLIIENSNASGSAFLSFRPAGSESGYIYNNPNGSMVYNSDSTGTHAFRNKGSDKVVITSDGNVGVGTSSPLSRLEVLSDSSDPVIFSQYTNTDLYDAIAVYGESAPADYWGFGGYFVGGYQGVVGIVEPTGGGEYTAVNGRVNGGSGINSALEGYANGDNTNFGLYAEADSGATNVGASGMALYGYENHGVYGYAESDSTNYGAHGAAYAGEYNYGVYGYAASSVIESFNYGVYGEAGTATDMVNYAGYFEGDVYVTGILDAATKNFVIDHPLDPENKYLRHACVESNQMTNVYSGNVVTDGAGVATVVLPEYISALNTDFRYQLTVIGDFAQAIISQEITDNQFQIRTDKPNVKVSWQVTGVRQDPFALDNPLEVESAKPDREQGTYLHPQAYGVGEERSVNHVRSSRPSPQRDEDADRHQKLHQAQQQILQRGGGNE